MLEDGGESHGSSSESVPESDGGLWPSDEDFLSQ